MECNIACQLDRIAEILADSDASGFVLTLVATLVGALVAAVLSVVLYRHELDQRKRGEVDAAAIVLMRAISGYSQEMYEWRQAIAFHKAQVAAKLASGFGGQLIPFPTGPSRDEIDTAVETLIVLTADDDRQIAERLRQVLYEATFIETDQQTGLYSAARRVVVAWRARTKTATQTLEQLDIIDRHRAAIEAGEPTTDLPALPEPYERASTSKARTAPPDPE